MKLTTNKTSLFVSPFSLDAAMFQSNVINRKKS